MFGNRKPESPAPRPAVTVGATFGPWATHSPRCSCNVCK